jgi:hypothetical protein
MQSDAGVVEAVVAGFVVFVWEVAFKVVFVFGVTVGVTAGFDIKNILLLLKL